MYEGITQSELARAPHPRVLLKPQSWMLKIEFINHLILFNNVLIAVLSEKEGGKTSFATLLQEHLDSQIKLLVIKVTAPCNREELIKDIAEQFHLKYDEETDISSLVAQINERRAHVLVMMDHAHHLPEVFIKEVLLAIKNQEHFSFFHLCLISDHSLVACINNLNASFFNNLVHTIEIGVLSEDETRTYVLQRAMATHLITKPLTDKQFKQFYHITKGDVAKINSNLELFIFNCTTKKPNRIIGIIKKMLIPLGTAVISGVSCLFFAKSYFEIPSPPNQPKKEISNTLKIEAPPVLVSQIASWQDSSTRTLIEHSVAESQQIDVSPKDVSNDSMIIADQAIFHAKVRLSELAKIRHQTIKKHSKLVKTTQSNPKLYTIQLAASAEKMDIARYQKSNKWLNDSTKLTSYTKNKMVWYVLTLGEYNSIADAQKKINQLPPTLKKLNPWIRKISSLG